MKHLLTILIVILGIQAAHSQTCNIPEQLNNKIEMSTSDNEFDEEDFYAVNNLLFDYEFDGTLTNLANCESYQHHIKGLFNSQIQEKRVLAYRLIGCAQDSTFNDQLIQRINSEENALSKTWSTTALMSNKCAKASDDLFKLFSSFPEGLPVDILINMYVEYDTIAVKNTCWKFIDSTSRNEQILALQCLANFEKDKKLQQKFLEFLHSWGNEYKGWVIAAMSMQKMNNLKPILEKYSKQEDLKDVVIQALESSETLEDKVFAKQLKIKN